MSEQRFESSVERQIREAQERGDFDNLPGAGKPLRGIDEPYDQLWWIRQMVEREKISITPPTLALRKAVEDGLEHIAGATSEDNVRRIVADLNARIVEVNRKATSGPPSSLMPLDVEAVVAKWQQRRSATESH